MGENQFAAALLRQSAGAYASAALAHLEQSQPDLLKSALPATFASPRADLEVRLRQLAEAVAVEAPDLFASAAAWYRAAYAHRGVAAEYLPASFAALDAGLRSEMPAKVYRTIEPYFQAAMTAVHTAPTELESGLVSNGPNMDLARRFLLATLEGRPEDALAEVRSALDRGVTVAGLHDALFEVQREVGRMWVMAEAPIADEHHATMLVERALDLLQERIPRPPAAAPRVLTFAVGGNLHDIGIRMVAQRLQLGGYAVTNLGGNLPACDLAFAVVDRKVDVLAVSATMLLHLGEAAAVVAERNALEGHKPPILFGGSPFAIVPDLHRRLGAEAGASTAEAAVAAVQRLMAK